jgi:hypothetical protein
VAEVEQTPRKPPGQIVKYDREFLLKFMDVSGLNGSREALAGPHVLQQHASVTRGCRMQQRRQQHQHLTQCTAVDACLRLLVCCHQLQRHIKAPMELQQLQLEIVISEDTERETQRQSLKVRMQQRACRRASVEYTCWPRRAPDAAWLCFNSTACSSFGSNTAACATNLGIWNHSRKLLSYGYKRPLRIACCIAAALRHSLCTMCTLICLTNTLK